MNYKPSAYNYLTELSNGKTVLYNFLMNGLAEVGNPEDVEHLKYIFEHCNEEVDGHMAELKEYLIDNQYLLPSDVNELDIIRTRNMNRRFSTLYQSLVIMPTLDCNFSCKYCYEARTKKFLGSKEIQAIKKWIETASSESKQINIGWFGGEPLLDFSIIEDINQTAIDICQGNKCTFYSNISTNGFLITDDIIKKVDNLNLRNFQITLDGTAEYHNKYRPLRNGKGSYEVVFENMLKILDQTKAEVKLRVNVDNDNYENIPLLIDSIPEKYRTSRLKLYFRSIFPSPNKELGINENIRNNRIDTHKILRDLYIYSLDRGFYVNLPLLYTKDHYCGTCLNNYFLLHPEGELFKCTVGFEKEESVGRVTEDGEFEINHGVLAKWMSYVPGDDEKCRECILLPACQGGCRFYRLEGKNLCPYERSDLTGIVEMIYLSILYDHLIE